MKIKRFFAKDMRSALSQVKEVLGSDAVIMSNKKVTGGIEIVAAIDHHTTTTESTADTEPQHIDTAKRALAEDNVSLSSVRPAPASRQPRPAGNSGSFGQSPADKQRLTEGLNSIMQRQQEVLRSGASAAKSNSKPKSHQSTPGFFNQAAKKPENHSSSGRRGPLAGKPDVALDAMQKQIDGIKQLLEHQVSGLMWQEMERREPLRAMLIKRLTRLGFSEPLADQLACFIPETCSDEEAWGHLQELLIDQLNTGGDDILNDGGVVALMGPTGVGKTTTIAKLAARAVARYGAHQVAMVSTDTFRIGAHEQLSTYARIMGCSVKVAHDDEELSEILYQLKDKKLVLIDTAGMSQRDTRLQQQLDRLMHNSQVKIKNYLVLSATSQRLVIEETFSQFKRLPLAGTILTKLDEALSLGEVLNVLLSQALPVTYITNGQRVPEDIDVADASTLVGYALNSNDDTGAPHFWVSDDQEPGMTEFYE